MSEEKKRKETIMMMPVVVRKSAFFLALNLIGLEILFFIFAALIRLPFVIFNVPAGIQGGFFGISSIISALLTFLKIVMTIIIIFDWIDEYYEISQKELIYRKGLFNRIEERFALKDTIGSVQLKQGFIGQLFHYGTIEINETTSYKDLGTGRIELSNIPNPHKYMQIIEQAVPRLQGPPQIELQGDTV